jgi:FKBP-type peptidyl-prolyl cis-trans isomerase
MKKSIIVMLCVLLMSVFCAQRAAAQSSNSSKSSQASTTQPQSPSPVSTLKGDNEKISYALGMRLAIDVKDLRRRSVDVDPNLVAQALKDSFSGKTLLTEEERVAVLAQLQQTLIAKEKVDREQMAEANLKEGEAFLASNKAREGVVTLPSGLQYKIITQGGGPNPTLEDTVVCNYKGTFINGKEFDSSYKRGEPATFPVVGVIRGWTEALQHMPVGSKWQLFIPAGLAYGESGHGRDIQPNTALIFEVELLSIKEKNSH